MIKAVFLAILLVITFQIHLNKHLQANPLVNTELSSKALKTTNESTVLEFHLSKHQ